MITLEKFKLGNSPDTLHHDGAPSDFPDYDSPENAALFAQTHADLDFVPEYGTDAETEIARLAWRSVALQIRHK